MTALTGKRSHRLKEIFSYFRWYDYTIIGTLIVLFWFLFLFPADLWHTTNCSLAYVNGHFSDFYQYNAQAYTRLDYYPLIYVIYAIWNIPLGLMGIGAFAADSTALLLYEKVFGCLFMLGSTIPFYLISRKIGLNVKAAVYTTALFLTTPYIFLSTFAWGMYDSINVFFLLLGLYYFLREKKKSDIPVAMILFGLSFSIKLISAFIIIPIVAYKYKNVFKLAGLYLLSLVPLAIQMLLYLGSSAFTGSAMGSSVFVQRLIGMSIGSSWHVLAIFVVIWACICLFAYFADYESDNLIKPLYICLLAATAFFCCIEWHPQWFILLAPFSVWTTAMHKNRNRFYIFDILMTCTWLAVIWTAFPYFEEAALQFGGLHGVFANVTEPFVSTSLLPAQFLQGYLGVMTAVLIISAVLKNPWKYKEEYSTELVLGKQDKLYAYGRFLTPIAFFLAPIIIWVIKIWL